MSESETTSSEEEDSISKGEEESKIDHILKYLFLIAEVLAISAMLILAHRFAQREIRFMSLYINVPLNRSSDCIADSYTWHGTMNKSYNNYGRMYRYGLPSQTDLDEKLEKTPHILQQ